MKMLVCCLIIILFIDKVRAQEKWDLRKCVEYALANNISIRQQDVQAMLASLTFRQSQLSQYPSVSLNGNAFYASGRSQNPVTFGLITQGSVSSGFSLQAGADLFNWYSKKNNISGNEYLFRAAEAGVDKLKNDIALNVAGAYLQVLLSRQQEAVSEVQVTQSRAQLENTRKLVIAGNVPELNALQLEAQLANDSSNLITAKGNETQAVLLLKAYLNIDAGSAFEVATPAVESIPVDDIIDLQPEAVYSLAVKNLPQQRQNDFNIKASEKFVAASRSAMYPTLSVFTNLASNYNSLLSRVTGTYQVNEPLGKVSVSGTDYSVYPIQPFTNYYTGYIPYFDQLNQNFRQQFGLSLSVPVANGGILRTNYERSRLNQKNYELQKQLDNQSLKQNIYKAYTDAVNSLAKSRAAGKTVEANQKAFDFATKRYNAELLNTIDLITTQNNLFSAKLQQLLAQFDYVFKIKVLEFYKGQGIRL